jgi:protein-disulfide isomerase
VPGVSLRARRLSILGVLVAIAVAAVVIAVASGGSSTKPKVAPVKHGTQSAVDALFSGIPQQGFALGRPDAPATLEEYVDPQCPYCAEFSRNALPTLLARYVRPGRVRLILRPLAFLGPDSLKGARAVVAASQQNKAWNLIDAIYANQGEENSGYMTDQFLRGVGQQVAGLNVNAALAARSSAAVRRTLTQVQARADRYGQDSTPGFLLIKAGAAPKSLNVQSLDAAGITAALDGAL